MPSWGAANPVFNHAVKRGDCAAALALVWPHLEYCEQLWGLECIHGPAAKLGKVLEEMSYGKLRGPLHSVLQAALCVSISTT